MPWYRAGTVAVTAGQTTVTGTGTNFAVNSRVGDAFQGPDGRRYEVTNIASATVLSILPAYQGPTVAAGAYVIEPVQGYPKALADSFREVNSQWGTTLAGLGAVSTEDVVPVAKGGTGGTNQAQARSGLGLKAAAVADIVGTVSQVAGIPTGSIIERGSSANGEFVKFADGTLICSYRKATSDVCNDGKYGEWFRSGYIPIVYPHAFVSTPVITVYCGYAGAENGVNALAIGSGQTGNTTNNSLMIFGGLPTSGGRVGYIAIGRWY